MSDASLKRRNSFSTFWPWPGIALLGLLAAWLYYMGVIAEVDDVRTAFFGMGAVTTVVALLGLRAARFENQRNVPRRARSEERYVPPASARRAAAVRRAAAAAGVADAGSAEQSGGYGPPAYGYGAANTPADEDGMPRNAQMRRASAEADNVERLSLSGDPPVEVRLASEHGYSGGAGDDDDDELVAALKHLEGQIKRERAERETQIARLEELIGDDENTEGAIGLEERLNQYLTIPAFNSAMNQKVFPRVERMIEAQLKDVLSPERIRDVLGIADKGEDDGGEDGGLSGADAVAVSLAEAQQALSAKKDEMKAEHDLLREEVRGARKMAEKAVRMINRRQSEVDEEGGGTAVVDQIEETLQADRAAVAALHDKIAELESNAGDAARGGPAIFPRLRKEISQASAATMKQVDERLAVLDGFMTNVRAMADKLAEIEGRQAAINDRLAGMEKGGEKGGTPSGPVSTGGDPGEVDALRDALTTIIEQNREIRQKQDMLTARFDTPSNADGNQDGDR